MSGTPSPTRLEAPTTRFFGRTSELDELQQLFSGERRLVTLMGPAGVGKTRLALELAWTMTSTPPFAGRVCFCDLSEAMTAQDICASLVHALDIKNPPEGVDKRLMRVGRHLAHGGPTLLVLDNFEQLIGDAPATVGALLRAAPEARLLVTSRVRLRLEGEAVFALDPLGEQAATALWQHRVDLVRPGYQVASEDAEIVRDLLEGLDRLPLAIELAAARMHVMGIREVRDRLSERLQLLSSGSRGAPARRASLEAALLWSWRDLDPWERSALRQCTRFRSGFDLTAAIGVVDLSSFDGAPAVLDVVHALVDKSLITVRDLPPPLAGRRLSLLRSIHDFVLAQEDVERDEQTARRHAQYYVELGESWVRGWKGRADARALPHLRLERDNLLAAATRAGEDPTLALRAALTLQPVAQTWGPFQPQLELVQRCLGAAEDWGQVDGRLHAYAYLNRGRLNMACKGAPAAEADWRRALELSVGVSDPELEGRVHHGLGACAQIRGDLSEAREHYGRALEHLRGAHNRRALGQALLDLRMLHEELGAMDEALECADEAFRTAGDVDDALTSAVLAARGSIHLETGRLDAAEESLQQALAVSHEGGYRLLEGRVRGELSVSSMLRGAPEEALEGLIEAEGILEEVGDRRVRCVFAGYRAAAHHLAGQLREASRRYDRARRDAVELGLRRFDVYFGALDAMAHADLDELEAAERRLEASADMAATHGDPAIVAIVDLARAQVELARARAAARDGRPTRAETLLRAARSAATTAGQEGGAGTPLDARSLDVRITRMLFERALTDTAEAIDMPELAQESRIRLIVDHEGRWFRLGEELATDVGRRSAVRRLLVTLCRQHLESPGVPIARAALAAAVWPGERLVADSAKNRLHVALSSLRKAGMRPHVLTLEGGYLLDPRVDVSFSEADD